MSEVHEATSKASRRRLVRDESAPWCYRCRAIAEQFHEEYEKLAPVFYWNTQEASKAGWADIPGNQRDLMESTVYVVMHGMLGHGDEHPFWDDPNV